MSAEKIRNVRSKYCGSQVDLTSQRLIQAEKLREVERENALLSVVISKLRCLNIWNRVKSQSKYQKKLVKFQEKAAKINKSYLENDLLHEQNEILLKEEREALKTVISTLEKECETSRKELEKEQKLKTEKSHTILKEAKSMRHLQFAKTSNIEKLVAELEQKDKELEVMRSSSELIQKRPSTTTMELKKLLKQTMQQVSHERNLKLMAFERVDELQKQVHEMELKVSNLISKEADAPYHETCLPLVTGGMGTSLKCRPTSQPGGFAMFDAARSKASRRPTSGVPVNIARPQTIGPKLKTAHSAHHFIPNRSSKY